MCAKKKLNILFYYYPTMWLNNGGLQNQIIYTKMALEGLGHKVFLFEEWILQKSKIQIDIYHQFSCHYTVFNLFKEFKQNAGSLVISTVFNSEKSLKNRVATKLDDFGLPILFHNVTKTMQREADFIISLGEFETNDLKEYSSLKTEIKNIPNGVSETILDFDLEQIVKEDYIVSVGSIKKGKNQLSLIKICKKLNYKLILIGPESKQEPNYVSACKELGYGFVSFLGFIDNNSQEFMNLVAKAKLFVLPSLNEVLPISVFESLILGTPVVCTNNSSIKSYLSEDDGCALCDPKSLKSISDSINKMYNFKLETKKIQELKFNYTWNNVAEQIQEVYYKTLNDLKL